MLRVKMTAYFRYELPTKYCIRNHPNEPEEFLILTRNEVCLFMVLKHVSSAIHYSSRVDSLIQNPNVNASLLQHHFS